MENPKYIEMIRQAASDFYCLGGELSDIAHQLETIDLYNPQAKLYSLVRIAEVNTVRLRNLAARTVTEEPVSFYREVAGVLSIDVKEEHDWIVITVPAILPKRNRRDDLAFLVQPLRQALIDFLNENPMECFGKCAICIVHQYDASLGIRRIRDYDNIETKRYLDVIEAFLLTDDTGLLCTILQCTELGDHDATKFFLMLPESLPKWLINRQNRIPDSA